MSSLGADWYESVFAQAPCGILVFDRELKVTECNERFAAWVGSSRNRLMGFDLTKLEDPTPLPRMREALAGHVTSYEGPYVVTATGKELFVRTIASPLRDADGSVVGGITIFEDISDRRRAENALHESEDRYRRVVELSPEPIFVQIDGKIAFANPATLRAFRAKSPDEFVGRDISQFVHEELSGVIASRIKRVLAGEAVGFIEQRFNRVDGTVGSAEVASLPMTFEGKQAVLTVARDITNRVDLEDQLRQAQKMEAVGLLAGGIAHDFNNLLTVIRFHAESLTRSLREDSALAADAAEIEKASERAALLTQQLLAFGRKQVRQPKSVDVNQVIDALKGMLKRLIGEELTVEILATPDLRRAHADVGQLEQVVMNLALNARDAMANGGTLTIKTRNTDLDASSAAVLLIDVGPYVCIEVRDTGSGMDAATKSRIFEPFFTTKGPQRGSGLGLSTVYGIVHQSGGSIRVESEPGRGSTFEILLPVAKDMASEPAQPRESSTPRRGHELVLLAEDEDSVRAIVKRILEREGYRVVEACDGRDALELEAKLTTPLDLLVTDMIMPRLGGRELYEALATKHPSLRVLYMSGYTDDEILKRGDLVRGSAFLQKPFGAAALREIVRDILDAPSEPTGQ